MAVAKQAGQFAGGFFNQPVVLGGIGIIAAIGIPLLIFRKQIAEFFGRSFGEAAVEGAGAAVGAAVGGVGESIGETIGGIVDTIGETIGGILPTPEPETIILEPTQPEGGGVGIGVEDELEVIVKRFIPDEPRPEFTRVPRTDFPDTERGVISLLPTEQEFGFGGIGFEGGFVFENPIDTLREVIDRFPQLSASQAADFLAEFSGILPSQLSGIDPDVKNITAFIGGENVEVENVGVGDLREQERIAACTSCQLFGLNCEICGGV